MTLTSNKEPPIVWRLASESFMMERAFAQMLELKILARDEWTCQGAGIDLGATIYHHKDRDHRAVLAFAEAGVQNSHAIRVSISFFYRDDGQDFRLYATSPGTP